MDCPIVLSLPAGISGHVDLSSVEWLHDDEWLMIVSNDVMSNFPPYGQNIFYLVSFKRRTGWV